jgi:hypothetical protein
MFLHQGLWCISCSELLPSEIKLPNLKGLNFPPIRDFPLQAFWATMFSLSQSLVELIVVLVGSLSRDKDKSCVLYHISLSLLTMHYLFALIFQGMSLLLMN